MKLDELAPELIEQAKQCTTREERLAFLRDYEIELTDEQLEMINGGTFGPQAIPPIVPESRRLCLESPDGDHHYVRTGKMVPGSIFGNLWPNYETVCEYCGKFGDEFAW